MLSSSLPSGPTRPTSRAKPPHSGQTCSCLPRTVGESRRYFTAQRLPADAIASDAVFTASDPDGLLFAVVSSSMFITWQKTVGGRLKSDPRFASTLTWNTFPLPPFGDADRAALISAGQGVLDAHALHPERCLAQHYQPLAMEPELVKAHDALDAVVDRLLGAPRRCTSESQRQKLLFERYAEIIADLPKAKPKRRRRSKSAN